MGSHALTPIVTRIRSEYPLILSKDAEAIFLQFDAFDFITLEDLSPDEYRNFVRVAENQLSQLFKDNAIDPKWRTTLVDCWNDLLTRLHQDPRY